jgi:uncharacterized membrane protein YjjB (DUF3815 family)
MDLSTILIDSVWAAIFAAGLGILFTAPHRYVAPASLCGFVGRFVRGLFISWGMSQNWSTVVAAAVIVLVTAAIIGRHKVPPVVLISGVIPLGATVAMFNTLSGLMRLSSAKGDLVGDASIAFTSSLAKVFTTTLAIAVGISAGMAIVRLFNREEEAVEV